MRVADYIIGWLYKKNIDKIFTVSGGGSIFLCDAMFANENIQYICCHHEQAVAFAAEGYARVSKKTGVGIVTTGPGGTNAITGVSSAWMDSVPLIMISGQVFENQTIAKRGVRQQGVQEINIIDLVEKNTKWSVMLSKPDEIKFVLEKAFYIANSGRPGPVWIDIPADIQATNIDIDKLKGYESDQELEETALHEVKINEIAQKLLMSKRPIIHVGHGVKISNAEKKLIKFVTKHQIPVLTTWNATGIIDSNNPCFVGRPGAFAERAANFNVQNSDFYLSIGSRLPFMVTGYNVEDFARNAFKVMVDIDKFELENKKNLINTCVCMDARNFIDKLSDLIPSNYKADKIWLDYCQNLRKKYPILTDQAIKEKKWVNSYFFISKLSELIDNKTNIITDMGLSFVGTHQAIAAKEGQNIITNSGHAPMGWGLPASIGAKLSNEYQTISINGEGGFMMNIQELATIMHHKLNIKIFIYNNGGYQTIKQTQQLGFQGRLMGCNEESGLSFPSFNKIANAHGIKYQQINNHSELEKSLYSILESQEAYIVELMIDPEQPQIPKAVNKRLPNGKSQASKFEDLYPFLPLAELDKNLIK